MCYFFKEEAPNKERKLPIWRKKNLSELKIFQFLIKEEESFDKRLNFIIKNV